LRAIRGNDIAMIFQDPMTALNPVLTIGKQMSEILVRNKGVKKAAKAAAIAMLEQVGIAEPERRYNQYPHEFSGGMRQRVMIAIALSCNPKLLIADEPTTALDVTIQAQILRLLKSLQQKTQTAILLVTHDLGVVAQVCSRVVVMYGGLVMEEGSVEDIFYRPAHPYTQGLLASLPRPAR
jgi:peptide/nickel transport system ATP-binding protein